MKKKHLLILSYAAVLALAAFGLEYIDYRHSVRKLSTELFVLLIALGFTVLGIWVGHRLTSPVAPTKAAAAVDTSPNATLNSAPDITQSDPAGLTAAASALGISQREHEVLTLLVAGQSNKEIARTLSISPNTVKTHVSRLYEKLGVARRTQAVKQARHHQLV